MRMATLMFAVVLTGCNSATHVPSSSGMKDIVAKECFANSTLTFMSWNGQWQGTDIDTSLTFSPDGRVQITHFGSGMDTVTGTYKTDGNTVTIDAAWDELVEMPGAVDFPKLELKQDTKSLYLFPAGETETLKYGTSSAWPLKQTESEFAKPPSPNEG